ncbi:MAG: hypothetical protein N2595_06925 [bacterium]|nr:hypothetical protein [bacterium]
MLDQVEHVRAALCELGEPHRILSVRTLADVSRVLSHAREDVVFNLVEALADPATVPLVPALCVWHGKACTGGTAWALQLTQHKQLTKQLLAATGLPVPPGVVVPPGAPVPARSLPPGQLIVKPLATDASEGISAASVCTGYGPRLRRAVRQIHQHFTQPALIESFFGTRELQAALLEVAGAPRVLTIAEIDFSAFPPHKPRIVDYAAKWLPHTFEYQFTPRVIPAPLTPRLRAQVARAAITAWRVTGCHDYARVDFRMDAHGRFVILEVNVNPDIAPEAGYVAALAAARVSFPRFVQIVLANARQRIRS